MPWTGRSLQTTAKGVRRVQETSHVFTGIVEPRDSAGQSPRCPFLRRTGLAVLPGVSKGCLPSLSGGVHAYVLMTKHMHLLLTPEDGEGISRVMRSVERPYVRYVNREYQRSGTLWEGRHKPNLIDAHSYLFICTSYMGLNPVRANMVSHPAEHRWSSHRANVQYIAGKLHFFTCLPNREACGVISGAHER